MVYDYVVKKSHSENILKTLKKKKIRRIYEYIFTMSKKKQLKIA